MACPNLVFWPHSVRLRVPTPRFDGGGWELGVGVAVSASFSCDRTQKYLYEIKLMAFVDVLLIYTMSRKGRQEAKVGGVW